MLGKTQLEILSTLKGKPLTAKEVAHLLTYSSYDAVHSSLRRMENRNLVRRIYEGSGYIGARWEVTRIGNQELEYNLRSN